MSDDAPIFHITTRQDWRTQAERDHYDAESLDREGFIHCSYAEDLAATAERVFAGRDDLLVLALDPRLLAAEVRVERPADRTDPAADTRFPHVYGVIERDAVVAVIELAPSADGFATPAEVTDLVARWRR